MKLKVGILVTVSCVIAGFAGAQSPSSSSPAAAAATGVPYTEHSVWAITLVKTKAGLDDDYLRSIAQTFKGTMEEEKKQGLIMDYKVLIGDASNREDFNILLMVEYKNMAAFDGLREKTEPHGQGPGWPGCATPTGGKAFGRPRNSRHQNHARG